MRLFASILVSLAQVQAQSISTDASKLTFPSKSSVTAELTQKQNKPVGGHWTDFSNNYGGCTTDVPEDVGPENRYQPMRDEEQCLMRKCMDPLKYTQRYRVCMLPDHPDVVSQSGAASFVTKLANNKNGKLWRFIKNNDIDIDSIDPNNPDDYKKIYDAIMQKTMQKRITEWKPARGWPNTYEKSSAEEHCQTTIGPKINTLYDALTAGSKWKSTPEKDFKTTTDLSFCEYDSDLGIFMGCQDQRYHSINPRCDPRFEVYADKIISANLADLEPEISNSTIGLDGVRRNILDILEKAHFLSNGRLTGKDGQTVHLTDRDGLNVDSAVMKSPWLYMESDRADCQRKCPVPLPWTAWSCSCDGNGAPKCCGQKQYRFRGCENQNQCNNDVTCAAMARAVTSSDQKYSYVQNCANYVGGNGPNACANSVFGASPKTQNPTWMATIAAGNPAFTSQPWWTNNANHKWEQSVDIRSDTAPMTKDAARNILKNHWTATGNIQNMNDEEFDEFSECFPSVDLSNMAVFGIDSCLGSADPATPFGDRFFKCLLEHYRSKPSDMAAVASDSSVFRTFLFTHAFSNNYINSGAVDWAKVFPGNVWNLPATATNDDTFVDAVISHITSNTAMGVNTAPSVDATKSMVMDFKNDMAGYIQLQTVKADLAKKYPRIIPGSQLSVNIAGKYKKSDYEASSFYRQNLQNIYENAYNADGTLVGGSRTIPGLGGLGTTNDDLTNKRVKNANFIGNYLADQTVTPTNTCNNNVWYTTANVEVQCLVENQPTDLHLGYTDEDLRSEWHIDSSGILTMKALKKNAKNTQSIETQDLAQALADWYNNLACKVEFAVQSRDDQCPLIPTYKTPASADYLGEPTWTGTSGSNTARLTTGNENECVAKFSDISAADCSDGYERKTLILKLDNLEKYTDAGGNLKDTKLTLYWNEDTKEWGKPNAKHYWVHDIDHDTDTGLPTGGIITPSGDYELRYAKYNKNDLCDTNFPTPKACKNPCKYKTWESWGSFNVNDASYPADTAAVTAGYPETRNARQRMGITTFTDMKTQMKAVDNNNFPMSYPGDGSDMELNTENFVLPWFGARSEFGDFQPAAAQQCFRVFETKESFSNVHALMTAEFARLKTLATKLIKTPSTWTGISDPATADDQQLIFLLNFVRSWLMDGLYEIKYGNTDTAPVQTDDFWSKINAFLENPVPATTSSGLKAGLVALKLDDSCTATTDCVYIHPRGVAYNLDKNRYEYIRGEGTDPLLGSEGWHLDVLKRWLNPADKLKPHGWRFACRNRDETTKTQGYMARKRETDCGSTLNPDCCGVVDIVQCELPVCPDWTEWTPYSQCTKSCIESQLKGQGYGYKIKARNCEAHSDFKLTTGALNIQLPETKLESCKCNTNRDLELAALQKCQTTSNIAATQNFCTVQLATCNTNKACPSYTAGDYSIIHKACPTCGTAPHQSVKQLACKSPSVPTSNDWDSTEPYKSTDCNFKEPEFKIEQCSLSVCSGVNSETKCVNGKKQVVNKGELEEVVCTEETFSDWSVCPASCKDRPVPKRFRWSSHGNVQSEDCAASTAECPKWNAWGEWSSCSGSKTKRTRTCQATTALPASGSECAGEASQSCTC